MGKNTKKREKRKRRGRAREREGERDQNTRYPGVLPIPSTQLPIQTGVSAPSAAVGDCLVPLCGPLLV